MSLSETPMSDLPSPETVRAAMAMKGGTDRHIHAMTLLDLAAKGRLVDREAIDYEAIHEHLLDFVLIQSLEDPGLSLNDVRWAVALGMGIDAAAIGDTDE